MIPKSQNFIFHFVENKLSSHIHNGTIFPNALSARLQLVSLTMLTIQLSCRPSIYPRPFRVPRFKLDGVEHGTRSSSRRLVPLLQHNRLPMTMIETIAGTSAQFCSHELIRLALYGWGTPIYSLCPISDPSLSASSEAAKCFTCGWFER